MNKCKQNISSVDLLFL